MFHPYWMWPTCCKKDIHRLHLHPSSTLNYGLRVDTWGGRSSVRPFALPFRVRGALVARSALRLYHMWTYQQISFLAAIDTSQYFVWWTWAWIWPLIVWLLLFVPPQVSSNQSFMCVPPQVSNSCCKNWADHLMNIKIRFRPKQLLWRFKMQRRSVWKT